MLTLTASELLTRFDEFATPGEPTFIALDSAEKMHTGDSSVFLGRDLIAAAVVATGRATNLDTGKAMPCVIVCIVWCDGRIDSLFRLGDGEPQDEPVDGLVLGLLKTAVGL